MNLFVGKSRHIVFMILALVTPVLVMGGDKGPVISSTAALKLLKDGNARFVSGKRQYPNQGMERLEETKKGQHPFVTILSCSDSRVPVEHIFDAGIGDIFIIRVAGNVSGIDEIATMEYGTEHLHTPLLVVLGHTACGAVTAVTKGDKVGGNIPHLVARIKPAVAKAKKKEGGEFSQKLLDAAIRLNVWQAIEDLFKKSHIAAELVKEKKLRVVGAIYHLDNGEVEWLGEHPGQKALLAASGSGGEGHSSGAMTIAIIIVSSGIMALLFLAVYYQFFRVKVGKNASVMARLSAGFMALVISAAIASSVNSWIAAHAAGGHSWIVLTVLPSVATILSIVFSVIFTKSMAGSFRRVIGNLKSMINAHG